MARGVTSNERTASSSSARFLASCSSLCFWNLDFAYGSRGVRGTRLSRMWREHRTLLASRRAWRLTCEPIWKPLILSPVMLALEPCRTRWVSGKGTCAHS